jgi:hypothetical protein
MMGDVSVAAYDDPVFWAHHCMIDSVRSYADLAFMPGWAPSAGENG